MQQPLPYQRLVIRSSQDVRSPRLKCSRSILRHDRPKILEQPYLNVKILQRLRIGRQIQMHRVTIATEQRVVPRGKAALRRGYVFAHLRRRASACLPALPRVLHPVRQAR